LQDGRFGTEAVLGSPIGASLARCVGKMQKYGLVRE
jgi:hypothetical protein